jgi:hypothetical protein
MLSIHEYMLSWGMYLLGALGLVVVWWRITAYVRISTIRNMLRLSVMVAVLMPYPVPEQETYVAPALMMTFIEGLFFEDYGFSHAGMPLLLALVLANVLYLITDLLWHAFRRKRETVAQE